MPRRSRSRSRSPAGEVVDRLNRITRGWTERRGPGQRTAWVYKRTHVFPLATDAFEYARLVRELGPHARRLMALSARTRR